MATARDVAIIVLALESIVIGILLVVLILQVQGLIRMLRQEIKPILDSVQETTNTVRGTAAFVSDTVVSPAMRVAGMVSALRRVVQVLTQRKKG